MRERLYQPSVLRDVMRRHGITPKKGFGQNFLIDAHALQDIVEAAEAGTQDAITGKMPGASIVAVEIGPGLGTLTQALAEADFAKVIAVEKDRSLMPVLQDTLNGYDNVEVVFADALQVDWNKLLDLVATQHSLRLVANLPYYITTPLLMHMLESRLPFERLVIMVQKEVAERIVANPGGKEYGALSLAVRYYGQPKVLRTVSAGCFLPKPQVDSAVVVLDTFSETRFSGSQERLFFRIVRAAFSQRRKTLVNALANDFSSMAKSDVEKWLLATHIDGMRRGETLSIEEFFHLVLAYQEYAGDMLSQS